MIGFQELFHKIIKRDFSAASGVSYPTQEDELRAKEAQAEARAQEEQSNFVASFLSIPKNNSQKLGEVSQSIVNTFNEIMQNARQEPFAKQENMMAGLKKLFQEEINVIDSMSQYSAKLGEARTRSETV